MFVKDLRPILFKVFSKENESFTLVLAGQLAENLIGGSEEYKRKLIEAIGSTPNIVVTGYVDDQCLGALYENCSLFVFPSVFEGFGMPPVEAMGFGCPVITTKCASLPEVTLNSAIYVEDPYDAGELCGKINMVVNNLSCYRKDFEAKAQLIKDHYSPTVISEKYGNVFLSVIEK